MKKNLLFILLIFSFVAISCLVFSVALAQEGQEIVPLDTSSPPVSEGGEVFNELMTNLSEDMQGTLNVAAEQALEDEEKSDELKMDEMIRYEDLDVTGGVRILPDSFFYNFKNIGRGINTFFTFDPVKKAEKELDYANKKIMESHQLVEEKGMSEDVANAVEKTIVSAEKDLERISNAAGKLKEQRGEDAPKIEAFLEKITNHTLQQQKVIEKLEDQLPEKNLAKVVEAKEKSLEHFGDVMVGVSEKHEDITERINKAMNEQEGSDLQDLKNLEVLEVLKDNIPEEAREAIESVQENRIMVFQEKFNDMPKEARAEKVDKYLGNMKGNALRQFDMLDDMKRSSWVDDELIKELDMLKDKMFKKFETKFASFTETVMKDQFMGHLMDGDPDDFRTLGQIEMRMGPMDMGPPPELDGLCFDPFECERYCEANPGVQGCDFIRQDFGPPPEIREAIKKADEEGLRKFKEKFGNDPDALKNSNAIQKALANPDAIDFQLLDRIYESMPVEQQNFVDGMKNDMENKMIDMMKGMPMDPMRASPMNCDFNNDGAVDQFESQQCAATAPRQPVFMMDRFVDPNPESMEILMRLRDRMPEADRFYMEQAMDQQMNRMTDHMYKMDDQKMFDRMKYQMEGDVTVKNEIEKRNVDFFDDIDMRRRQLEEEMRMLDGEKMRRMEEMKMEMMRGQRDFQQFMPTQDIMNSTSQQEMMMKFEGEQRTFQDSMRERGVDPCDFNNDGRIDEYESQQCHPMQTMPTEDQGFFNRFRGQEATQDVGPCDFNQDGYVDLYESRQCAQTPPPMPTESMPSSEESSFFDRFKDTMPFGGQEQGVQCGGGDGRCSPGDYCANPANGWCCPNGMTYDPSGPGGCIGESTPPPSDDKGFFDRMRDYVPFIPDSQPAPSSGAPCDFNGDERVDEGEAERCKQEGIPEQYPISEPGQKQECGSNVCMGDEYCADFNTGRCVKYGEITPDPFPQPEFDFCDFNKDGLVDQSEMDQCTVVTPPPPTNGGWCGDGRCESNEHCPQDCQTSTTACNYNGTCDSGESVGSCSSDCGRECYQLYSSDDCKGRGGCEWCPETSTCSDQEFGCGSETHDWCGDNVCNSSETVNSCPSDCSDGGMGCDYDNVCEGNENNDSCPNDCGLVTLCGNGACDSSETMNSCPVDCGGATPNGWCGDNVCALNESSQTCPGDCGNGGGGTNCDYDGICDWDESEVFCPDDCSAAAMSSACDNDGNCEYGETMSSCPADCGGYTEPEVSSNMTCDNDGVCDSDETSSSCSDCSTISVPVCGDGYCSYSESESCPGDCGSYMPPAGGETSMSCTTWVSMSQSCDPVSGICCSDGMCSNMNGPGTCEDYDMGGDYYPPPVDGGGESSGWCGDGTCDGSIYESSSSCPADCGVADYVPPSDGGEDYYPPPSDGGGDYYPPPEGDMSCPPEGCMPMSRGKYPKDSWLRSAFAFIFGF
ncbi:MAG: hypothetical protein HQ536_00775 [Parcubacteria group bacterium]|nr:hypothetical protein [Parcubacteria group bacterium]